MKVKISKKPAVEKKKEPVEEPKIPLEILPPCPWPQKMTVYGPPGGQAMLISDPNAWAYNPHDGWIALYTVFGKKFYECMNSFNSIEAFRKLP